MEKKTRKTRTLISIQFKETVVRDHHDNKLTFLQIAHKYSCCFKTAKTICERNEYGFWNKPAGLTKRTLKHFRPVSDERKKLTTQERMKLLVSDAMEVIELTLHQMILKLKKNNCDLTASQLASFMAVVAPYAKSKKSDNGKKDNEKEVTKNNVFSMFKEQLNKI